MQNIALSDAFFQGAVSVEHTDGWQMPWRLPCDRLPLFTSVNDALIDRAACAAGVRIRLRTDSERIGVKCVPSEATRSFDLTIDNRLICTHVLQPEESWVIFEDLPDSEKVAEIWLPQTAPVQVLEMQVAPGSSAEPDRDERRRWVTYGSSITHCGAAHSPSRTWPATAARLKDVHLTCLGYGGNCHLEPMVARMIRDLPADIISLKLGINVQGAASLSRRTFKAAVIGMVETIREKHAETPLVLISPIISPPRETQRNAVGLCLTDIRSEIEDAAARLKEVNGDRHLYYVNGLELFGEDLVADCLPDQLHPNGDGYDIMGRKAADNILGFQ